MISGSRFSAWAMFSPRVLPVTVGTSVSRYPASASSRITALTPPASSSSMKCSPAGARWQRLGVFSLISLKSFRSRGIPASWAMAGRCRALLVEQPRAMSTVMALRRECRVTMSRGRTSRRTRSMMAAPACLASWIRAE